MRYETYLSALLILNAAALYLPRDGSSAMAQSKSTGSLAAGDSHTGPITAQLIAITGMWRADKVAYAPWTLRLKLQGTKVTGTVSQGRYNPDRRRFTTLTQPVEIYDGTIRGNVVSFKCASPGRPDRIISFTGTIDGDEINFTRTVQVRPGGNPGEEGIFGASGATHFIARRAVRTPSAQDRSSIQIQAEQTNVVMPLHSPSEFPELPQDFQKLLIRRGCQIPEPPDERAFGTKGVISGDFAQSGQTDWAVMCDKDDQTSVVVFWAKPKKTDCDSELAKMGNSDYPEGHPPGIKPISSSDILNTVQGVAERSPEAGGEMWGSPPPDYPNISHSGIMEPFDDKGLDFWYCSKGRWYHFMDSVE